MHDLSAFDLLEKVEVSEIPKQELLKATRQFYARTRKLREKKRGHQKSWLLASVDRINHQSDSYNFLSWLSKNMILFAKSAPNSLYKLIFQYLAQQQNLKKHFQNEIAFQRFSIAEGMEIAVFPTCGLIAMISPPGNLKHALEESGISCSWNWPTGVDFFSNEDVEPVYDLFEDTLVKLSNAALGAQKKYGRGKGSTIALLDSGICPKSVQFSGRKITQIEIVPAERYWLRKTDRNFTPQNDHGNLTATLAAGNTAGIAPLADIISFVMPKIVGSKFDHVGIYVALETIATDRGAWIEGICLSETISTILIPLGVIGKKKADKAFYNNVEELLRELTLERDINVVAAVGNTFGKVAFPSQHLAVHAVGCLNSDLSRNKESGFGIDQVGGTLPNISVVGVDLVSQGRDNKLFRVSGSSFSAAIVAGYFTILSNKYRSAAARSSRINSAIDARKDEIGELKVLHLDRIV